MKEDGTYSPISSTSSEKSRTAAQQPDLLQTLADVREALAECDILRLDPSLPDADRRDMDAAALTLRNLERELIDATSETLLDRLEPRHPHPRHRHERPRQDPRALQAPRLPRRPHPPRSRTVVASTSFGTFGRNT